jgi:hypothetical protein
VFGRKGVEELKVLEDPGVVPIFRISKNFVPIFLIFPIYNQVLPADLHFSVRRHVQRSIPHPSEFL